jgi:hypothetical protein
MLQDQKSNYDCDNDTTHGATAQRLLAAPSGLKQRERQHCGIFLAFPRNRKEGRKGWGARGKGNMGPLVPLPPHRHERRPHQGRTMARLRPPTLRPRQAKEGEKAGSCVQFLDCQMVIGRIDNGVSL